MLEVEVEAFRESHRLMTRLFCGPSGGVSLSRDGGDPRSTLSLRCVEEPLRVPNAVLRCEAGAAGDVSGDDSSDLFERERNEPPLGELSDLLLLMRSEASAGDGGM